MLNLLIMPIYNQKIKIDEPLQIGFEKKYGVERIFGKDAKDIYFNQSDSKYKKIGTLFLDYLSDSISELYVEFLKDVLGIKNIEEIEEIEEKYINAYTFYFKYLFKEYLNDISDIINSKDLISIELIEKIGEEIENIEKANTVNELIKEYTRTYSNIIRGSKIRQDNKAKQAVIKKTYGTGLKKITIFFLEICFLKQLYKLLVEYCYFNENTIDVKKKTNNVNLKYLYFRGEYEKIKSSNNRDFLPICSLSFLLPPAMASVNEKEGIMYTYLIDECEMIQSNLVEDLFKESFDNSPINKEIGEYIIENSKNASKLYTHTFFRISLLQLLESNKKICKCKNCGRYFVLRKEGTLYCSNPSPQNRNRTCSSYMKEYNYKNKLNSDKEKEKINSAIKKAGDRIYSLWKPLLDTNENREKNLVKSEKAKKKWKESLKNKKEEYKNGNITLAEFVDWLDKSNRKR